MSEMHHDPLIDHDLITLPADVQPLVEWLAADGAGWRAGLPSTATLDAAVTTLALGGVELGASGETATAARDAVPSGPVSGAAAVGALGRTRTGRAPVRLAGLAGVAAMIAIVTLIASVFAFQAGGVHGGRTATGPKPTATPPPDTAWVDQPRLGVVTLGGGNQLPVVAPSDARVVYEAYTQYTDQTKQHERVVLQRSDDGGATWHTLANPVPGVVDGEAEGDRVVFIVSPLDAHTVIVQESLPKARSQSFSCPAPFSQYNQHMLLCQPQYRSTDGGATWVPLVTPDYGVPNQQVMGLRPPAMAYFQGNETAALRTQGNGLYSAVYDGERFYIRIVASEDGGANWHMADEGLVAQGVSIEDYAVTPTGSTVFAVTSPDTGPGLRPSPLTLWRSADAGATWRRVGPLPTQNDDGLVAVATADAAKPLLYLDAPSFTGGRFPDGAYLADDLKVSTDGGRTWQSAPTAGLPTQMHTYPGLVGVLTDGSVVVGCMDFGSRLGPPGSPFGPGIFGPVPVMFYAWKLGAPTWRQLTPALTQGMSSLVITTAGGQDTLWATDTVMVETPAGSGSISLSQPTRNHVWRFRLP